MEITGQYRADAADLAVNEFVCLLRLPDGSEIPFLHNTFIYDEAMPDPAAPDCALAPAFDETAEQKHITVVFASGTPEEQTCQYTLPADIQACVCYRGKYVDTYEDAACTQLFTRRNGRTEFTLYARAARNKKHGRISIPATAQPLVRMGRRFEFGHQIHKVRNQACLTPHFSPHEKRQTHLNQKLNHLAVSFPLWLSGRRGARIFDSTFRVRPFGPDWKLYGFPTLLQSTMLRLRLRSE